MNDEKKKYRGYVTGVDMKGAHQGPFAYAECVELNASVTFLLDKQVWHENSIPEYGDEVVLWNLRLHQLGWRARDARFFTPED